MDKVRVQLSKKPKFHFDFPRQVFEELMEKLPDGYELKIQKIRVVSEEMKEKLRERLKQIRERRGEKEKGKKNINPPQKTIPEPRTPSSSDEEGV